MKYITCYKCHPPRSGKHYFLGGKPVHVRQDCPPGMIYFLNEYVFYNNDGKKKKGGRTHMMKKKGMTKNQKLKLNKTAASKKMVKATKK